MMFLIEKDERETNTKLPYNIVVCCLQCNYIKCEIPKISFLCQLVDLSIKLYRRVLLYYTYFRRGNNFTIGNGFVPIKPKIIQR